MVIHIENNRPIPADRCPGSLSSHWRKQLSAMRQGEQFIVQTPSHRAMVYAVASSIGAAVKTTKLNGKGVAVTRIK